MEEELNLFEFRTEVFLPYIFGPCVKAQQKKLPQYNLEISLSLGQTQECSEKGL